jgi:hypothetical protein
VEFETLSELWLREAGPATDPGQLAPVLDRLQALERTVRRRDWLETGSALAMIPIFVWVAATTSSILARAGALVIVAACVLIPLRLRAARRGPFDRGDAIADALRHELDRVRAQERLLRSVVWWYLFPLGLGLALFILGSVPSLWVAAGLIAVVAWLYAQIWRLNQRSIERQLEPRIRELLSWLASLEPGDRTKLLPGGDG